MTEFLPPVIAVLGASITEFKTAMGEARGEMAETDASFKAQSAAGAGLFLGVTAAVAGLGYEAVKAATGFDQAMEMVHTQAGAAQTEVDGLKGKVLALAPAVGTGPETLAEGLYHIESAGFRGAAAMDILTASAKLAKIGQSDFETTSQAVVGVMASQIKGVKDANDAGALLNTTVGIGDMKMQQLAEAIGTGILPKAASVGLSFEDVGAALATITDNVTPANEAATRLGMTFSLMAAPTQKAKGAYESIGMTSNQMANDLRSNGLVGALEDLKKHLDDTYPPGKAMALSLKEQQAELKTYATSLQNAGYTQEQQGPMLKAYADQLNKTGDAAVKQSDAISAMFGGGKSSGTLLTLLNELPRLQEKFAAYGNSTTRAAQLQEAWQKQQGLFGQKLHELGAEFDVMLVKLGEKLIPVLTTFLGWIQKGISWLDQHRAVVAVLAGVLGGVLVSALMAATGAAVAFLLALDVNPIFLAITAIGGLVGGLIYAYNHSARFRQIVDDIGRVLRTVWNDAWHYAGQVVQWFNDGPMAFIRARLAEFSKFWDQNGQQIITIVRNIWSFISDVYLTQWKIIYGGIKDGLTVLQDVWKFAWDLVKNEFTLVWDQIRDQFMIVWHLVLNTLSLFADLFTGKWGKLWGDAKHLVSQAFGDIGKYFSDFASNSLHLLWQAGVDVVNGLIDGLVAAGKFIANGFAQVVGFFNRWTDNALTLLYQAGINIIDGLVNGISSAGSKVGDTLWNIGKSAVDSVTGFFGINSPSRLMHEMGGYIGQGLANGILASQPQVEGAFKELSQAGVSRGGFLGPNIGAAQYAGIAPGPGRGGFLGPDVGAAQYAGIAPTQGGQLLAGGTAGANGFGGDGISLQVDVYLDGKKVQGAVRSQVLRYQLRNSRNGLALSGVGG